jgi:hypothetical protein
MNPQQLAAYLAVAPYQAAQGIGISQASQAANNALAAQFAQGMMNTCLNDPLLDEVLRLRDEQPHIAKASWAKGFGWGVAVSMGITLLFWLLG